MSEPVVGKADQFLTTGGLFDLIELDHSDSCGNWLKLSIESEACRKTAVWPAGNPPNRLLPLAARQKHS
jgi:hypothetical protein